MKRYKWIVGLMMSVSLGVSAQEASEKIFTPPFDFPLTLSGNFGELRANHFHGGLDFKTQGAVGKPIRNIADGYVSRVTVTPGGYGQDFTDMVFEGKHNNFNFVMEVNDLQININLETGVIRKIRRHDNE